MIKLDENLLTELGLGVLPKPEKTAFLKHMYETLEMRVGTRLAERMSDQQMSEFEQFINSNDEQGAFQWLEGNFPNYKEVVAEEFEKLKGEIRPLAAQIVSASQAQAAQQVQGQGQQVQAAQPSQQLSPDAGQSFGGSVPQHQQQPMSPQDQFQQPPYSAAPQSYQPQPMSPQSPQPQAFDQQQPVPAASNPYQAQDFGQSNDNNSSSAFGQPVQPQQPGTVSPSPYGAPQSAFGQPTPAATPAQSPYDTPVTARPAYDYSQPQQPAAVSQPANPFGPPPSFGQPASGQQQPPAFGNPASSQPPSPFGSSPTSPFGQPPQPPTPQSQ